MARLEEWKPTVCEEADGNAGLDRLQLASKRHLQRVSKSGLLKKFLVEEQNGISIKWDFLNFVIFIEQNGIPFVREGTVVSSGSFKRIYDISSDVRARLCTILSHIRRSFLHQFSPFSRNQS